MPSTAEAAPTVAQVQPTRSADPPKTLQIASVVDQVYEAIRERIRAGDLARGGRIHQEDIAAWLGVSRTPVREALRRLAAEGVVEMHTNRGARVADISPADMRAFYEALDRRAGSGAARGTERAERSPTADASGAAGAAPSNRHDSCEF